ncbi:hypothetical protein Tco_1553435 [Tanacetum coccineum]
MSDVALKIVKSYPALGTSNGNILGVLARKPESFPHLEKMAKKNEDVPENWFKSLKQNVVLLGKPSRLANISTPRVWRKPSRQENISTPLVSLEKPSNLANIAAPLVSLGEPSSLLVQSLLRRGPGTKLTTGNVDHAKQPFSERIVKMQFYMQKLISGTTEHGKEDQNLKLKNIISHHIARMHYETQNVNEGPTTSTSKVNDDKLSIFHIAVKHRHEGIYNLLYEIGSMKDLITPLKDGDENNMLHLVGKSAKRKRLQDVSGVAFQMQRELLWFKNCTQSRQHESRKSPYRRSVYDALKESPFVIVELLKSITSECFWRKSQDNA